MLIATGQRRDEVGGIQWQEIDLAKRLWVIPGERAKNGDTHVVALSGLAVSIIENLPRIGRSEFVFPSGKDHARAATGFSTGKARVERLMEAERHKALNLPEPPTVRAPRPARGRHPNMLKLRRKPGNEPGILEWRLHDVCRTVASKMGEIGIDPHVMDAVLNHKSGTIRGVTAIYNRFRYEAEKQAALIAWGRHLAAMVGEAAEDEITPGKVVELSAARG